MSARLVARSAAALGRPTALASAAAAALGAAAFVVAAATERWPSGTFGGGQAVTASGIAYRCEAPGAAPTAPAPATAGCTKDVECKGDRICEAGRCIERSR